MPALPATLGSQWLLGPTHAEMATTGVAGFACLHPVCAGSPGKAWWRSNPRPLPAAATPTLGGGARYRPRAGSQGFATLRRLNG